MLPSQGHSVSSARLIWLTVFFVFSMMALDSAPICSVLHFSSSSRSSNAFISGSNTDNTSLVKPIP
jgi:hypothetical protein